MKLVLGRPHIFAALVIFAQTTTLPANSQTAPDQTPNTIALPSAQDLGAWLDGFMPHALATADIAGAVVAVADQNGLLISRGYGVADLAAGHPVDPAQTLFRAGSVSKLLTWTAVMQLVEDDKIDLDTDVGNYLDFEVPTLGRPVTMRDLMTHRAGFAEVLKYTVGPSDETVPLDRYLRENKPVPLTEPGAAVAYSNYGTALAGHIVSEVSGLPFEIYVERNILDPLNMTSSSFAQPLPADLAAHLASGYRMGSDSQPMPSEIIIPSPAGALSSTGEDMARFATAHLSGQVPGLSESTLELMHTPGAV